MYDFAIIGGGIIGLSTAMSLGERYPDARILLLEKEKKWAWHQTGRNSGVIHSGIYYKPGSLKARFAREGNAEMVRFCQEYGIPHEVWGKVIVATERSEYQRLEALYNRSRQNQLKTTWLDPLDLKRIEPHVNGLAAIHVPSTGIIDYRRVCETMAYLVEARGGELRLNTRVERIEPTGDGVEIQAGREGFRARTLINCAGLQSDRVARMAGQDPGMKIMPFRGEYYQLKPEKRHLVHHLIYPVPNPDFPFLGVHFTRMVDGGVEAGPNAVLSLKREGYRKTDISLGDLAEIVSYPGMWRLASRYWREGADEVMRSLSKAAFVRGLQRLVPEIRGEDLEPAPSGIRAQALRPNGELVDDFCIISQAHAIHVCNAPSPAATASLPIGRAIAEQVAEQGGVRLRAVTG